MPRRLPIRELCLLIAVLLWPVLAVADRYGIQEAMEDGGVPPGGGAGMKLVLSGVAAGALIGYVYSLYYNSRHKQKIAADGCMIIGGLLGAPVLSFLYILVSK